MSRKIRWWCDSGANASSCLRGDTTLEELGLTESEWNQMTPEKRDEIMREIACDRLDWGYTLEDTANGKDQ